MMLEFEAKRVQLHTEYSSRLLQADEELRGVVEERQLRRQLTLGAKAQDVVTLDVGGKLYTVKRETLCLCRGSFLAEIFSGRWDSSLPRDKANHIFLDIDPEVFDVLLAWLRDCKIGQTPATAPSGPVAPEKMQHFQAVVDFFGLRPYLSVKGFGPDAWGSKTPKEVTEVAPERSFLKVAGSFLPWRMAATPPAPTTAATSEPGLVPAAGVAAAKVVGWSQKNSDPLVEHEEVNICCLPDTRKQRKCCTARSTRGYQSGVHRFGVRLLNSSNCAVGLVCSDWSYDSEADGHADGHLGHLGHRGWAVASDGSTWAEGRELERLPISLGEGTLVVFNLELGAAKPLRSATLELNGVLFRNVFTDLPDTVYPAVSNTLGAPGRFQLLCDLEAMAAASTSTAAKESAG